jgi:hypothetical protein
MFAENLWSRLPLVWAIDDEIKSAADFRLPVSDWVRNGRASEELKSAYQRRMLFRGVQGVMEGGYPPAITFQRQLKDLAPGEYSEWTSFSVLTPDGQGMPTKKIAVATGDADQQLLSLGALALRESWAIMLMELEDGFLSFFQKSNESESPPYAFREALDRTTCLPPAQRGLYTAAIDVFQKITSRSIWECPELFAFLVDFVLMHTSVTELNERLPGVLFVEALRALVDADFFKSMKSAAMRDRIWDGTFHLDLHAILETKLGLSKLDKRIRTFIDTQLLRLDQNLVEFDYMELERGILGLGVRALNQRLEHPDVFCSNFNLHGRKVFGKFVDEALDCGLAIHGSDQKTFCKRTDTVSKAMQWKLLDALTYGGDELCPLVQDRIWCEKKTDICERTGLLNLIPHLKEENVNCSLIHLTQRLAGLERYNWRRGTANNTAV